MGDRISGFVKTVRTDNKLDITLQPIGYDHYNDCLLYTSDAADERSSVDLGGRRIIKKKKKEENAHQVTRREYNRNNKNEQKQDQNQTQ